MKKSTKLTVLKVAVGEEPEVVAIDNALEEMQKLVGGWIETVKIAEDILLIVDEEGMMKRSPLNFQTIVLESGEIIPVHEIYGNVFFVSMLGEDFHSLDKLQIRRIKKMFESSRSVCVAVVR